MIQVAGHTSGASAGFAGAKPLPHSAAPIARPQAFSQSPDVVTPPQPAPKPSASSQSPDVATRAQPQAFSQTPDAGKAPNLDAAATGSH
jgi:hypothetical protein